MSYSQKPLLELMGQGRVFDEKSTPKHIETVISNVFVFDSKVYKVYKNDNDFFNKGFRDISGKEERFSFTEKDFAWNNSLSPSIYTGLVNVAVRDGHLVEVSRDDAEEVVFVMNRVNTDDVLFELLMQDKIGEKDCFEIGRQFGESMRKVQKDLAGQYNFNDLFEARIRDLRDWIKSVPDYITPEESDRYCDYLEDIRKNNREWFEGQLTEEVTVDGDFHSHNAIYGENKFYLMDTYPPKDEWGLGHKLIALYRIGVDMWALSGKQELFESFLKGYEEGNGIKIDRKLDAVYVIYAAGIAVSYLYMLQKTDPAKQEPAERFHKFIRQYFEEVK